MWSKGIFLIIFLVEFGQGLQVTLYENKERQGNSLKLKVKGCMNIPAEWDNQASSVDTHGDCVIFYEKQFCKGKHVALQPYHQSYQEDLAQESLAFSDVISSVASCGPNLAGGNYVIQNAADGSILSVNRKHIFMHPWHPALKIRPTQQWKVNLEETDRARFYEIIPVERSERKNPLTFDKSTLYEYTEEEKESKLHIKTEPIVNQYYIESAHKNRYRIRNAISGKCLYAAKQGRLALNWCDNWTRSQEWVFRSIPKTKKQKEKFLKRRISFD